MAKNCAEPLVACESGLECSLGLCRPFVAQLPVEPPEQVQTNEQCTADAQCPDDHICTPVEPGVSRCLALPAIGSSCMDTERICHSGAFCDAGLVCRALPVEGETCNQADARGVSVRCAEGFTCDMQAMGGPSCIGPLAPGESCLSDTRPCPVDTNCICLDADCAALRCLRLMAPGEACGDPAELCHPGTRCENGICNPRDPEPSAECAP